LEGFRHENKYFISQAGYQFLRGRLAALMQTDPHAAREDGRYWIRSLYFDGYGQSALLDKRDGIQDREKFRIRFYDRDDSFIRLESKQKRNMLTRKVSAPLTREEAERIAAGDIWFLYGARNPLLRDFYLKSRTRLLRPTVLVDYDREAYLFQDVRITFDHNLHTGQYGVDLFDYGAMTLPVLPDDRVILEVKFDEDLPYAVRQLLKPVAAVRSAISKYELCRQMQ
jgi:hypothetical protein